jgi:hypothetical protein
MTFFQQAVSRAKAASARGLSDEDALMEGWRPFVTEDLTPAVFTLYRMGTPHDIATIAQSLTADMRYAEFRDPEMFWILVMLVEPVMGAIGEIESLCGDR